MPERRGMVIKNVTDAPITVRLDTREIALESQEETPVTAEEVRDATLRDAMQRRTIAVVRPTTAEEVAHLTGDPPEASGAAA